MARQQTLRIEVVYARSDTQQVAALELAVGATVRNAVQLSGLLQKFSEVEAGTCQLGISGRLVLPEQLLRDGDRVEIYRRLQIDPKQARRERAREQH